MINVGIVGDPVLKWALKAALEVDARLTFTGATPEVLLVWIDTDLGILSQLQAAPCIAIGRSTDPRYAACAILAGAKCYVSTAEAPKTLTEAIHATARGEVVIPPEVLDLVKAGGPLGVLTPRERQVMDLLTRNYTNSEIAAQLKISVKTVDTFRGHLLDKLNLRNNVDLVRFAIRYGYAPLT